MAKIKIPPVLRASTGGEREVSADGDNVGAVLNALADAHPETKTQLFADDGGLNRYVNVYLNDEDVRVLGRNRAQQFTDALAVGLDFLGAARGVSEDRRDLDDAHRAGGYPAPAQNAS